MLQYNKDNVLMREFFFVLLRLLFQIDEVRYCHIFTLNIEHYYDNIIDKVAIWTIILNYRTVLAIALIPPPPTHLGYLLRYFDGFLRSQHVRNFFISNQREEGGKLLWQKIKAWFIFPINYCYTVSQIAFKIHFCCNFQDYFLFHILY